MSVFNRFSSKGTARALLQNFGVGMRVVNDNRPPLYLVFIFDKSGSMLGVSTIIDENGELKEVSKIEQLNTGIVDLIRIIREFEANNPLNKIYVQIIELDSYGKAVFPEFQPVSRGFEEIRFEADGCTDLKASISTLKTFLTDKYLRDDRVDAKEKVYSKEVMVYLMSDGRPTDVNGVEQSAEEYRAIIDDFRRFLVKAGLDRVVCCNSMAVGDDSCEDMLRYFCDGDEDPGDKSRLYRVGEYESIGNALVMLTHSTLMDRASILIPYDDEDIDDDDIDDDIDDDDGNSSSIKNSTIPTPVNNTPTYSNSAQTEDDDTLSALFDGLDE